jgi:hypothetical protein
VLSRSNLTEIPLKVVFPMQDQILLSETVHPSVISMVSTSGACIEAAIDIAKQQTDVMQVQAASTPASAYIGETGTQNDNAVSYHRYNVFLTDDTTAEDYLSRFAEIVDAQTDDACAVRVQA